MNVPPITASVEVGCASDASLRVYDSQKWAVGGRQRRLGMLALWKRDLAKLRNQLRDPQCVREVPVVRDVGSGSKTDVTLCSWSNLPAQE